LENLRTEKISQRMKASTLVPDAHTKPPAANQHEVDPNTWHDLNYHYIAIVVLVLSCLSLILFYFGHSKGRPNVISGTVIVATGLTPARKVYVQVSCMGQVIFTTPIIDSDIAQFDASFSWSFRGRKQDVILEEDITFDVIEANRSHKTDHSDRSIFAQDVSMDTLLSVGVGHLVTRTLSDHSGHSLEVAVGLYSNNHYMSLLDDLNVAAQQNRRKISFWTRLSAMPVGVFIIASSFKEAMKTVGLHSKDSLWGRATATALPVVDMLTGAYFLYASFQGFKINGHINLPLAWSVCLGVIGYMSTAGRWLVVDVTGSHVWRLITVIALCLGFLMADLRGEPGSGWLSYLGRCIFTPFQP
jgi:hypothetical protein